MLAAIATSLSPDFDSRNIALGGAVFFSAGLLRGFTGYGFSLTAVPLLSLIWPPVVAVPIVLILQLMISVNGLRGALEICDWRSIRLLALAAIVTTPFGVLALTVLPANTVRLCLAAVVLAVVLVVGRGVPEGRFSRTRSTLLFGSLSGLFNGLAGMPGPPVIAFYLASGLGSARSRACMIVLFLLTSAAALVPLSFAHALTVGSLILAAASFPAVWIGSRAGAWLYGRSSDLVYRLTGLTALSVTALVTAYKALFLV